MNLSACFLLKKYEQDLTLFFSHMEVLELEGSLQSKSQINPDD